ncbi:MAG: response regulator [Cyanobacteria bacterium REEB67]|nr:response regulator [Cyanobacteria bacterium REEB67]
MTAQILALLESSENTKQVLESLKQSGHAILSCHNFAGAIEILEGPLTIDLIISDVHLENGGNVFDFLRWVRDYPKSATASFVLLSINPTRLAKYLEDGTRMTAKLLGVDRYISMETFDACDFRQQIDKLLDDREQSKKKHQHHGLKKRDRLNDRTVGTF